jgi:hypothetical protein
MARTGFRRSLAFVVMPIIVILAGLIFANSRGLWEKFAALKAGVFSIAVIAYFMFRFDDRPEQDKRAGWLGVPSYLCILAGMTLYYLQNYAGLRLGDMTIAFPILFFVPTVSFLIYVLMLVVGRFHPNTGTRLYP